MRSTTMTSAHLTLLGAPYLTVGGVRVSLSRKKALALFAYLSVTVTPHTRDSLAAFLWGDSDERSAHAYLRNALWTLSKALGASWVLADSGTVALNRAYPLVVDVHQFTQSAQADSAAAAALYTGEFMAGFSLPDCPEFDHWQTLTAHNLQRTAHQVFASWTAALSQAGQVSQAVAAAQRWVALDPLHEPAHRMLMQMYAAAGETTSALRQYRDLGRLLREELRAQPAPETTALYERLLQPPSVVIQPAPLARPVMPDTEMMMSADPLVNPTGVRQLRYETFIVGRESERDDLLSLLSDPLIRLITITGAGGMGKTRLSEQMGAEAYQAGLFPDGAFFISLTPLCNADAIAPTLLSALPFMPPSGIDAEHSLREMLREKRVLLVIDNCEHVLDGVALFNRLIEAASGVKILATSRERLALRHERVYELRGLPLPSESDREAAQTSPTVGLFVTHAQHITPDFTLTPDTAADIAQICRLVEGMPLAIELAAAWTPLLTPAQIAIEVKRSLDFLTTTARDLPERHRSLRAVFDSSWQQMSAEQQMVLARLAVFRGGFTVESASAVAGASLQSLLALVNKSLLKRGRDGRFEIHELLRQFADLCLTPDDRQETRARHARYFAAYLQAQSPKLYSAEQPATLELLKPDIDNLRTAIQHAIHTLDMQVFEQITDPIGMFNTWIVRYDDFGDLLLSAADAFGLRPQTDDVRVLTARLLVRAATIKRQSVHQSVIDGLAARAAALLEPYYERFDTALTWLELGALTRRPSHVPETCEIYTRRGLALFEQLGHRSGIAYGVYQLGTIQHMTIRYEEAYQTLQKALSLFEDIGQPLGLLLVLDMLSENRFTVGDYETANMYQYRLISPLKQLGLHHQAMTIEQEMTRYRSPSSRLPTEAMLQKSLNVAREAGDRRNIAWTLYNYGWMKWYMEEYEAAVSFLKDGLALFSVLGDEEGVIWTNIFLADSYRVLGDMRSFDEHVAMARHHLSINRLPWGDAGLAFVLGDAALAMGDTQTALDQYRVAVSIAHAVQSIMQILRHLCGIADVWFAMGRISDAVMLCHFVISHPATWDDALRRARLVLSRAGVTDAESQALQSRAAALSLEAVLQMVGVEL